MSYFKLIQTFICLQSDFELIENFTTTIHQVSFHLVSFFFELSSVRKTLRALAFFAKEQLQCSSKILDENDGK